MIERCSTGCHECRGAVEIIQVVDEGQAAERINERRARDFDSMRRQTQQILVIMHCKCHRRREDRRCRIDGIACTLVEHNALGDLPLIIDDARVLSHC